MKRTFLGFLLALALAAQLSASSTTWKVTTWNLEWFPSGKPDFSDAVMEAGRISEAAKVLRELDPDVILLEEVRDQKAAVDLATEIGRGHQVVVVSRFKQGNRIGQQQQAILAKFPAKAAYWREWATRQLVNPPRGYSFAVFETASGKPVAFYAVHMKSNAMGRDVKDREKQATLNRLQRELAAQELVEHFRDIGKVPELAPASVIVGGDFNTDPTQKRFGDETTLATLVNTGFANPLSSLPVEKRTTIPGKGRYPDTTFDYLLFWKATPVGDPIIRPTKVSEHRPVTWVVELP